jgi:hypothetical protein
VVSRQSTTRYKAEIFFFFFFFFSCKDEIQKDDRTKKTEGEKSVRYGECVWAGGGNAR